MASVVGPLPPTQENWTEFQAPGFGHGQPWLVQAAEELRSEQAGGRFLFLSISLAFQIEKNKYLDNMDHSKNPHEFLLMLSLSSKKKAIVLSKMP